MVLRGDMVLVAAYKVLSEEDAERHITWKELACFGELDHVLRHVEDILMSLRGRVRMYRCIFHSLPNESVSISFCQFL